MTGGKGHGLGGLYYEPTVLTNVTEDMQSEDALCITMYVRWGKVW